MNIKRIYNQAYYDHFYTEKDFLHFKQDRQYIQMLCSYLPVPGKTVILDVGCGRGYWSRIFWECGIGRVVGIDISQVGLSKARREVPEAEFLVADARHLIFKDGTFDMIFCQGLSEHNTDNLSKAVPVGLELFRCLKEGGLFVFAYSTNFSGKQKYGWQQHEKSVILKHLSDLGGHIEAVSLIERALLLKWLGKFALKNKVLDLFLPVVCRLTGLPVCLVGIIRKI